MKRHQTPAVSADVTEAAGIEIVGQHLEGNMPIGKVKMYSDEKVKLNA
jgi:hypothetical protein